MGKKKASEVEFIYTAEDMKYVTMHAMQRIREAEEATKRAEVMIRCIIEAAGGEVVVPARVLVTPPKYLLREDSRVDMSVTFATSNMRNKRQRR